MNESNPHILITGVSRGIGFNVARLLLARGWNVTGFSRTKPEIEHDNFSWYAVDLSKPESLGEQLKGIDGSYDAILHNAGAPGPVGKSLELSLAGWKETFDVNVFSPIELTRLLLPHVKAHAAVMFLGGGGAVTKRPLVGPYAVSKLAEIKLAEQLALEYPEFRFYAIAPGAHETALQQEHVKKAGEALPRYAEFSDVERLVINLIQDTEGKLNGKLVHVRDELEKLTTTSEGGFIRRIEAR